jgi:hypothetical protein
LRFEAKCGSKGCPFKMSMTVPDAQEGQARIIMRLGATNHEMGEPADEKHVVAVHAYKPWVAA